MDRLLEEARDAFTRTFGESPSLHFVRSPGCVTIIGDHTDYHGGLALPAAISLNTILAFQGNEKDEVRLHSVYFGDTAAFSLQHLEADPKHEWIDYVHGVAQALQKKGIQLKGFDGVLAGSLPVGAGLGSSAALTAASALAFLHLSGEKMDPVPLAQLCEQVESRFVGKPGGIVDPLACLLGQSGVAIRLDCHTLEVEFVPLPSADAHIVLCDTTLVADQAIPEMLRRMDQCREGVRQIARRVQNREMKSLRDVTLRDFKVYGHLLSPQIQKRIKHVVTENQRVQECAAALHKRNIVQAGVLLDASHASLRDDYEVSCRELDMLTEIAWNTRGVLGARMTGLGFGGITVNLVDPESVGNFCEAAAREYKVTTGTTPNLYVCQTERGAEVLS